MGWFIIVVKRRRFPSGRELIGRLRRVIRPIMVFVMIRFESMFLRRLLFRRMGKRRSRLVREVIATLRRIRRRRNLLRRLTTWRPWRGGGLPT